VRAPHNGLALRKWGIRRLTEDDFLDFFDPGKIKFPISKLMSGNTLTYFFKSQEVKLLYRKIFLTLVG